MQFRLAGQKGSDATASNLPNLHYSKLHFKLESAIHINPGVYTFAFLQWFCSFTLTLLVVKSCASILLIFEMQSIVGVRLL
ncbi:hypothetical protein SAMN05421510_11141 [Nitrosomonas ureae]|uniref:Uncharacterized protein n=1 Tax=Nitrosomonas ureae TaxID=44577 RepID=A0A1H9HJH6_9PROT|nr:hypothetical protein SAMN05421510_11141 [Nitrosomonas ureae]